MCIGQNMSQGLVPNVFKRALKAYFFLPWKILNVSSMPFHKNIKMDQFSKCGKTKLVQVSDNKLHLILNPKYNDKTIFKLLW